jgi:multiple antibiotic resistance protein
VIADAHAFVGEMQAVLAGALVLVVTLALLLFADPIYRLIGPVGTNVIRRVMGMVLAAFAVNMTLSGFVAWLNLPPL